MKAYGISNLPHKALEKTLFALPAKRKIPKRYFT